MADKLWIGGDGGGTGSWAIAANWSPSGVPVAADVVYIDINNQNTIYPINAGLDQSLIDLDGVHIAQAFTGLIGLTTAYLQIRTDRLTIGNSSGRTNEAGSKRINIELQNTTDCVAHIYDTATTAEDTGRDPLIIKTANSGTANHNFSIAGGIVGLGSLAADDEFKSQWVTITPEGPSSPQVTIGAGATATNLYIGRGEVHNQGAAMTLVEMLSGEYTAWKGGAHTTMNVYGGMAHYYSNGTITTLRVSSGGVWETTRDARAKTVTTTQLLDGGSINARTAEPASVTWTNSIDLVECGLEDVSLDIGDHVRIQQASI